MLSLYKTTKLTKQLLKWAGISIIALLTIIFLFKGGTIIKEIISPTPPPPPTVSFGKLPSIEFPVSAIQPPISYSLDTVTGALPVFPDRVKVYKFSSPPSNLLALKRAEGILSKIGFQSQPVFVADNVYQWTKQDNLYEKLVFDILTFNLQLSSDFIMNDQVLKAKNLPNEVEANQEIQSFLTEILALPTDLDQGKTKTTFFSIKNSELIPTASLSTAQLIRIDLFQKDVDKLPIYYSNHPFSTMNFLVGSDSYGRGEIVKANLFHQNISNESATYPIKTAEEVLSLLKEGKAHIVSYNGDAKNISIKNIFLGYYMGETPQEYLTPIVIFEGDNGFTAYMPIIKDDWIKN